MRTRAKVRVRILQKDSPHDVVVWEAVVVEGMEHWSDFGENYMLRVDRWSRTTERIHRRRRLFGRGRR